MRKFLILMLVLFFFVSGCGSATALAIYALFQRGEEEKAVLPPGAPSVVLQSVEGTQSAYVDLNFTIIDSDEDTVDVTVEYDDGGWKLATEGSGGLNPFQVAATQTGVSGTFVWNARIDLFEGTPVSGTYTVRFTVSDDDATVTASVDVDIAIQPPEATISSVEGESDDIVVFYSLTDPASDVAAITARYRKPSETGWKSATISASSPEGTTDLATSPTGVSHAFVWDSATDLPGYVGDVEFQIEPRDEFDLGAPVSAMLSLDNNSPPEVTIDEPSDGDSVSGMVTLKYTLIDAESDEITISVSWWDSDVGVWKQATMGAGSEPTSSLSSSPTGVSHTFVWDSNYDLQSVTTWPYSTYIRILPMDAKIGTEAQVSLSVEGVSVPSVVVETPSGTQTGPVTIDYTLYDSDTLSINVTVEYSLDGGANWNPATLSNADEGSISGNTISGQSASESGVSHWLVWDSTTDAPGVYSETVRIRITPDDGANTGSPASTADFVLNNTGNQPPSVTIDSPSGGDTVKDDVLIEFTLTDNESDTLRIEVEYSPNGLFWYPATLIGSDAGTISGNSVAELSSSSTGVSHWVRWDSRFDNQGRETASSVGIRMKVFDPYQEGKGDSVYPEVNNTRWSEEFLVQDANCSNPQVAVTSDGVVHIVWQQDDGYLYYKYGRYRNWSTTTRVTAGSEPALTVDSSDTLHLAFRVGKSVYHMYREEGAWYVGNGGTPLFKGIGYTNYMQPAICVDSSSRIFVVCCKVVGSGPSATYSLVMKASSDGGANWSDEIQLVESSADRIAYPKLCAEGSSYIHIVYDFNSLLASGRYILYTRYDISGGTSSRLVSISTDSDYNYEPDIAYDGENSKIWVVWGADDGSGDFAIYSRARDLTTGDWESIEEVSSPYNTADEPEVAVTNGVPCSVWHDVFDSISHILSSFRESTWSDAVPISFGGANRKNPEVTAGPGGLYHTVWVVDDGSGNYQLFYAVK